MGKTFAAETLGKNHFKRLAVVDLERNPDWHAVFDGNLDAKRIRADLEILLNQKIIPGDTLTERCIPLKSKAARRAA